MTNIHHEHRHLDVACELQTAEEMQARAAAWQRLREEDGLGSDSLPGGARLWLRPTAWDAAANLAQREAACCGFLDFDLVIEDTRVRLDITSPVPEAQPVIACLAGVDANCALQCC